MGIYFGTDGIRGEVNKDLTVDLAFKLGKALSVLNCNKVVIGYDTRLSNQMLYNAIAAGALAVNINVINAGVITTPGLCLYSKEKNIIGVMITASHNPYQDNGIKVFLNGQKLTDELEDLIEKSITNPITEYNEYEASEKISNDPIDIYTDYLLTIFQNNCDLKIGLDCAHGATSHIAEKVFSKITPYLYITANKPNGKNINNNVGATATDSISKFVKENNLDIGFSFDGDGDRLMVADKTGKVYFGDEILYIMANYLKNYNKLADDILVLTRMSNIGIINSLNKIGVKTEITDVGDRNVLEKMLENNYSLGGENSGHFIILELMKTGDGMLSALFLLRILSETNKSLSELTQDLVIYPDKIVNIKVLDKSIVKEDIIGNRVKEINNSLGKEGLLIVRASGTENLVRVSCCAPSLELVDIYVSEMVELINTL